MPIAGGKGVYLSLSLFLTSSLLVSLFSLVCHTSSHLIPKGTHLCEVSAALEGFALNEEQDHVFSMAAPLYRYRICQGDAENDKV